MMDGFEIEDDEEFAGEILDDDEMEELAAPPGWERYENAWFGKYRASVEDTADPEKFGRVMVKCPLIYGPDPSPWCEPAGLPGADSHQGMWWPPEKKAIVWIEFEEGDPDRPVWSFGPWFDATTGLPQHAQEKTDETDSGPTNPKGLGAKFIAVSTAQPKYANWRGWKTPGGHMLEFDDTPGKERVQLWHKSGAHLEIREDGSVNLVAMKNLHIASYGGEVRMASIDATGAATANEVGMAANGGVGCLGTPALATEKAVCGTALETALNALVDALTTFATAVTGATVEPTLGPAATTLQTALQSLPPSASWLSDAWKIAKVLGPPEP